MAAYTYRLDVTEEDSRRDEESIREYFENFLVNGTKIQELNVKDERTPNGDFDVQLTIEGSRAKADEVIVSAGYEVDASYVGE